MKKLAAVLGILMLASCSSTRTGTIFGQARPQIGPDAVGKEAPVLRYVDATGRLSQVSFNENHYTLVFFNSSDSPAEAIHDLAARYPNVEFIMIRPQKEDCLHKNAHKVTDKNLTVICDPEALLTKLYTANEGDGFLVNKRGKITKTAAKNYAALAGWASKELAEQKRLEQQADIGS